MVKNLACRSCKAEFESEQDYWFHRGWPYDLEYRYPDKGFVPGVCVAEGEAPPRPKPQSHAATSEDLRHCASCWRWSANELCAVCGEATREGRV
jgi:hypothetical protein